MTQTRSIQLRWGMRIPLRDGVRLNATMYEPRQSEGKLPCLFTLTPYVSDTYHERALYFASRGFPFVIVDVRGRGNSEGSFRPLIQEARDGYDVVEWLARQSFCNGKVAMWGGSYGGYAQWATAKECPPSLAAIAPAAAACIGIDFPISNNIFMPYVVQWLTFTSGRALQNTLFRDNALWAEWFSELQAQGRPFCEADARFGNPSPLFQEWILHPHLDEYWDTHNPTAEQLACMQIPILSITGIYDTNQPGALENYRRHMRHAPPAARERHHLIIGPWDHAGTRMPQAAFGGLRFGPASLVDLEKLHWEWYRWTLQGAPKPAFLEKAVAYYVTGAEKWRYADTLDSITARWVPLHLQSSGNPTDVYHSGTLADESSLGGPDHYRYDPTDLRHAELERAPSGEYLIDQRKAHQVGAQLFYHSAPFTADVEVSGFFRLQVWLSIDQPDTDFLVTIHAIDGEGNATLLTSDLLRARYRESLRAPKLIQGAEPSRYDFERFRFVSRRLRKGERLRLRIGPLDSIHVQKNYNSGKDVSRETSADARIVAVKVLHDAAHPSALYVPVAQPESPDDAQRGCR
jgi:uncharacterized protein